MEKLEKYKSDLKAQGIQFSDVKPPKSQNYELGDLTELYKETLELLTDETKGFKMMKAAADEKSPLACTLLGDLYARGQGTTQDQNSALSYYLQAAKQGEPFAKKRLKELQGKK